MMGDSLVEHELGRTTLAAVALIAAIALAVAWRRRKQRSTRPAWPRSIAGETGGHVPRAVGCRSAGSR